MKIDLRFTIGKFLIGKVPSIHFIIMFIHFLITRLVINGRHYHNLYKFQSEAKTLCQLRNKYHYLRNNLISFDHLISLVIKNYSSPTEYNLISSTNYA